MPTPLHRSALSRRAFLRGSGALLSLPWLSAMAPALGPSAPPTPVRALFIFAPNGKKMDDWKPKGSGGAFEIPFLLEPLKPWKKDLFVATGLGLDGADAQGDGPGDHARAAASFLTAAHPKKTGGADIRAGISVDQVLANHIGGATRFPSLELGLEAGRASGICDSGYSCAYSNNISWKSDTLPMAKEVKPKKVFARLFGDPGDVQSAAKLEDQRRRRKSILDLALEDAKRLRGSVGAPDARKLDEYLAGVRDLEKRLAAAEPSSPSVAVPAGLKSTTAAGGNESTLSLLYEMIALAFESDTTRVATLMLGNGGSNRSYPQVGVSEGHHDLSHHGKDQEKLRQVRLINRWHIEQLAAFYERLTKTSVEGKSLSDQSLVLYGSGISDGDRHDHHDLPIIVLGRGGGFPTGRHHSASPRTPLANLHLAILRHAGARESKFGDSTGPLV